tara:strand:- start:77 stop:280 length:204 start_codon:yes stop_codon:yes gene_type:complete
MSNDKTIMWGWDEPTYQRSEEHRKFLIQKYNKNRPKEEHVHTIDELNRALMTNEINELKDGKGNTQD